MATQTREPNPRLAAAREPVPKLAYNVDEFVSASGLTRSRVYEEITAGRLRTFKIGKRRMVSAEAAREFLARAEREGGSA